MCKVRLDLDHQSAKNTISEEIKLLLILTNNYNKYNNYILKHIVLDNFKIPNSLSFKTFEHAIVNAFANCNFIC